MWTSVVLALALTGDVLSQTIRNPARKSRYDSGEVHSSIMDRKHSAWNVKRKAGEFLSANFTNLAFTPCTDGRAGEFKCSNVDLYSFKSHAELGSQTGEGSSSWGWTHEGRDFAIVAQADGASFSEINAETGELEYLGRLPNTQGSQPIIWREIRVMGNIAVIGSEAANHHIQFFDLTKLLDITAEERPKTFDSVQDVSLFRGLPTGRTHNVVANTELQYAVSVGSAPRTNATFGGGLVFIDLKDPSNPKYLGAQAQDGYVHDAQCLVYRGPDTRFAGDDICYGYNEDTLTIYNVTDKAHATIISRTGYVGAAYTHQGWVLDPNDQSFLVLDDEYDEVDAVGPAADGYPVTYIWDIRNLTAPVQTGYYKSSIKGIDHNQYILNGKAYQSNYGAGLRILDVSSIPTDPTGAGVKEIGFFDIFPEDDEAEGGGAVEFQGSWSSYPFASEKKWILINTIERGAYVVKYAGA